VEKRFTESVKTERKELLFLLLLLRRCGFEKVYYRIMRCPFHKLRINSVPAPQQREKKGNDRIRFVNTLWAFEKVAMTL